MLDNAHGRGAWGSEGAKAVFWVRDDCPLHGGAKRKALGQTEDQQ